ncbi:hypothetical protein PUNSTDRAFT_138353 [Punctularia strigosozonata HHB-11173 SS5]|uniref:Uncharacterized protein n=1 Tax=Punctularia strigosozonata (strain HHB-11173) TaxID=741275 RepID=R7S3B2_PUNST|nr:uncharacterized protein PUNSTDRAFT_138353 [Punctularia strigosozonata HHB-11173 SS5]EIN04708.1 hypothetical protein PUNSTDRAFT_138353 [Punctularia strigosozonata HHB-11173 SS5]
MLFSATVDNFGKPAALTYVDTFAVEIALADVLVFAVQMFFTWQLRIVLGLLISVKLVMKPTLRILSNGFLHYAVITWGANELVADVCLTTGNVVKKILMFFTLRGVLVTVFRFLFILFFTVHNIAHR